MNLPWSVEKCWSNTWKQYNIHIKTTEDMFWCSNEERAKFIVTACNNHYKMLELLKELTTDALFNSAHQPSLEYCRCPKCIHDRAQSLLNEIREESKEL